MAIDAKARKPKRVKKRQAMEKGRRKAESKKKERALRHEEAEGKS